MTTSTKDKPLTADEALDPFRVAEVLQLAVREALLRHKQAGNPIAVWRDGRGRVDPAGGHSGGRPGGPLGGVTAVTPSLRRVWRRPVGFSEGADLPGEDLEIYLRRLEIHLGGSEIDLGGAEIDLEGSEIYLRPREIDFPCTEIYLRGREMNLL